MKLRTKILVGSAAAFVLIATAGGVAFLFLVGDEPPPVSLAAAVEQARDEGTRNGTDAGTATATPATTGAPSGRPGAAVAPAFTGGRRGSISEPNPADAVAAEAALAEAATVAGGAIAGSLDGRWEIAARPQSFAGYRVEEQLVQFGVSTAVGRTSAMSGSLEVAGSAIVAVSVEADLTQLQSDQSFRDSTLRRQGLETGRFPTATFELRAPIVFDAVPDAGEEFTALVRGTLTLHGVTRDIEMELQSALVGELIVVVGSIQIEFADYGLTVPSSLAVVSTEDHGLLELQLFFERAA